MKMKLKNFDDAYEAAKEFDCAEENYIFGLSKSSIPWGECIEVEPDKQHGGIKCFIYNEYYIPHFCFEKEIALTAENVMRYGNILEDTEIIGKYSYYRIKIIAYEKEVYYIKMQDGEIVNFTRIGREF